MVQIPRDQGGMTGAIRSLCVWDLEFESLSLWRKDPKRVCSSNNLVVGSRDFLMGSENIKEGKQKNVKRI